MLKTGISLTDIPVVLASGSPRRVEILKKQGVDPYIIRPDCSEEISLCLTPAQMVMALALKKSMAAKQALSEKEPFEDYLMISCDTVVALEGRIMGKPRSNAEAYRMLCDLNGKVNSVYSGVCLYRKATGRRTLFFDRSDVHFVQYSIQDVVAYVATGEPMDKAGGYAIQGGFAPYCSKVDGSFSNVVGLPIEKLIRIAGAGF